MSPRRREAETTRDTMRVDEVQVGTRYRRDLGDIDGLAASIGELGLLHPIVVTPTGELIAGERRLAAIRQLGWTEVPVNVVDLDEIVRGELDENTVRKDFVPSEIAAIAQAMRPIEERAAKERQREAGQVVGSGQASGKFPEASVGETRNKIAAKVGVSGRTVEKIEAVVEAAREDPETFADVVEEMDRTGKVEPAFKKVRKAKAEREQAETDKLVGGLIEQDEALSSALALNRKKQHWGAARAALVQMQIDLDPAEVPHLCDSPTEIGNAIAALQRAREWLSEVEAALAASVSLRLVASDA